MFCNRGIGMTTKKLKRQLTEYEKEVLAVLLDMGAVGTENGVPRQQVIDEVERRMANRKAGMET